MGGNQGASSSTGSTSSTAGTQPMLGGPLGLGGSLSVGGDLNSTGGTGAMACQEGGQQFVPKVPTVVLLVDRSGTMFKDAGNPWGTLRDGVLEVVQSLNEDVRFGFVAVTGEQAAGMCPLLDEVAPADKNYDAVAAKYKSLVAPVKGESPGMRGIERASDILAADTSPGDKYILFVTDGEQDYCDDGDFACPTDSVVFHLQETAAKGFKTFIFGLPMKSDDAQSQARYPSVLQAFADAGMGLAVAPVLPPGGTAPLNIFYNCQGVANWKAEAMAAGRPDMQPLGTYSAASGGAKVFTPGADASALKEEIAKVLAGVKSCTFDLGGDIKVVQSLLSEATVDIDGTAVPLDATGTNGWHMPTPTQIELVGDACTKWRMPSSKNINWGFPCKLFVPK